MPTGGQLSEPGPSAVDGRRAAFGALVDDASLFPPVEAGLADVLPGYLAALDAPTGWVLGRLLVPARLLPELADRCRQGAARPRVGVVLPAGPDADWPGTAVQSLRALAGSAAGLDVDAVEVRAPAGDLKDVLAVTAAARAALGPAVRVFLELDWREPALEAALALVATAPGVVPVGVKLRCGGPQVTDFPGDGAVARFLGGVRRHGLPMKATQGLHHPFRQRDPLTGAMAHGFVNLLAALALPEQDAEQVVGDTDAAAFSLSGDGLRWRGRQADPAALLAARALLTGLGSCSLAEPLADLQAYGLLPSVVGAAP